MCTLGWSSHQGNKSRKDTQHVDQKEEIKLPLFSDDIKYNISRNLLLEQVSEFRKIAGYEINIPKTTTFLYINNEHMDIKIQNEMLFIITKNRMKLLGVNLNKNVQDLYSESYTVLIKETKDLSKWRDIMDELKDSIQ